MPYIVGISFGFRRLEASPSDSDRTVLCCARLAEAGTAKMRNKRDRQAVILQLVQAGPVSSQEELKRHLADRGLKVTQATLSRDLRDLGLARVTTEDGVRYVVPDARADDASPALDATLAQFLASADGVSELIVLHTLAGGAGDDWRGKYDPGGLSIHRCPCSSDEPAPGDCWTRVVGGG